MDDADYIESVRKSRAEAVRFFSSMGKQERELWVAEEFLRNLAVTVLQGELVPSADDPPDVYYKDAAFEIKEILDPGRKRHEEYKASLRKAEAAKHPSELLEECSAKDITYSEIVERIQRELESLDLKYAADAKRKFDLLFYVNLEDVWGYVAKQLPMPAEFSRFGWRSISFLAGPISCVLFAHDSAPTILRDLQGRAARKQKP